MSVTDIEISDYWIGREKVSGERMAEISFDQIYKIYRDRIFNYLLYLTDDPDRAADLYQECMLKIYRNLKHQSEEQALKAWIYAIARNTYLDDQRKRNRRHRLFLLHDNYSEEFSEPEAGKNEIPAIATEEKDANDRLKKIIGKLPEAQREVIIMHYILELSFREVAEHLNLSVNTVAARARYGLQKIRTYLGEAVMKCVNVQDRFLLYINDELGMTDHKAITEHLKLCSTCTDELAQLKEMNDLLIENLSVKSAPVFKITYRKQIYRMVAAAVIAALLLSVMVFYPAEEQNNSLVWENGQFEQLLSLSRDLERIDNTGGDYLTGSKYLEELRKVNDRVSFLENIDQK